MAITSVTITSGPTVVGRSVTLSGVLSRDDGADLNHIEFLVYTVGFGGPYRITRPSDGSTSLFRGGAAGSGIAWDWFGTIPEGNYLGVTVALRDSPYTTFATSSPVGLIALDRGLSGIWTPRRDARGRFVPKDPTYPYPSNRAWNQTKTFFYPTTTGIYRANTDYEVREGQYGGIARGVPTPYGLGIDAPTAWEWKGPNAATYSSNTDSGFIVSVFSLYGASQFFLASNFPAVLGESRAEFNATGGVAAWWKNPNGEQSILVRNTVPGFGGGDITINGVGNGLHCLVVCFTVSGGVNGTRVFLNGRFVGSGPSPTYLGWMWARPYYFYSGISQSSLNIGNVHFQGEAVSVNLSNDAAAALSLDPYRYFFVDAPSAIDRIGRTFYSIPSNFQYSRPTSDILTGWSSTGANHFSQISETTSNQADYVYATSVGAVDSYQMGEMLQPPSGSGIDLNFDASGSIKFELLQGATVIKSQTVSGTTAPLVGAFLPQIWRQQPQYPAQIYSGHPLARGLQVALVPTLNADSIYSTHPVIFSTTKFGASRMFLADSDLSRVLSLNRSISSQNWTLLQDISPTPGTFAATAGIYSSGTERLHIHYRAYPNNTFGADLRPYAIDWNTTQTLPTSGDRLILGVSIDSSRQVAGYVNGRPASGGVLSINNPVSISVNQIELFKKAFGGGGSDSMAAGSTSSFFYVWNRALSDSEMRSISENPWQIFKPLPTRKFYLPGTSSTISISSSELSQVSWPWNPVLRVTSQ